MHTLQTYWCNGVFKCPSQQSITAPLDINNLVTSSWPCVVARCSGVLRFTPFPASQSTPWRNNNSVIPVYPLEQLMCKAVASSTSLSSKKFFNDGQRFFAEKEDCLRSFVVVLWFLLLLFLFVCFVFSPRN